MKKSLIKTSAVLLLAAAMLSACRHSTPENSAYGSKADFTSIQGSYDELFTVINADSNSGKWISAVKNEIGDAENLEIIASGLKSACAANIYGDEAVAAYTSPDSARFDCFFINGIKRLTFEGSKISATGTDGNKLFEYEYFEAGDFSFSDMPMEGKIYETNAENAGEFKYFFMLPDTPESTYHMGGGEAVMETGWPELRKA